MRKEFLEQWSEEKSICYYYLASDSLLGRKQALFRNTSNVGSEGKALRKGHRMQWNQENKANCSALKINRILWFEDVLTWEGAGKKRAGRETGRGYKEMLRIRILICLFCCVRNTLLPSTPRQIFSIVYPLWQKTHVSFSVLFCICRNQSSISIVILEQRWIDRITR